LVYLLKIIPEINFKGIKEKHNTSFKKILLRIPPELIPPEHISSSTAKIVNEAGREDVTPSTRLKMNCCENFIIFYKCRTCL